MSSSELQFAIATAPASGHLAGAISILQVNAPQPTILDDFLRSSLKAQSDRPVQLADFFGVDRGICARVSPTQIWMMAHGGAVVTQSLIHALQKRGLTLATAPFAPSRQYPEARSEIEACMLETLSACQSPLAIGVLLHQRDLWDRFQHGELIPVMPTELQHRLRFLCHPPTIVAIGAPNIGKSSLLNTLARRTVSIVADVPGTTRDHVGVRLALDGLIANWLDTPGLSPSANELSELDRVTQSQVAELISSAALIVSCADARNPFVELPQSKTPVIRCALRADLGQASGAEMHTSARLGTGLEELARRIRQILIPDELLNRVALWVFHDRLQALV